MPCDMSLLSGTVFERSTPSVSSNSTNAPAPAREASCAEVVVLGKNRPAPP